MDRFYCAALARPGEHVALAPEETRHLVKVLRAGPGDEVALFDGAGTEAVARLGSVEGERARAEIVSVRKAPHDVEVNVTVATAIPKGPRMADLVRSCSEVGVARIQPMVTERSVVRPKDPGPSERLVRVAREAARQSGRAYVPDILPVAAFDEVLVKYPAGYGFGIIADRSVEAELLGRVLADGGGGASALLMIGPEGGFTPDEIERAEKSGCRRARLDCPVMRVETAAAVLAAIVIHAGS